MNKIDQGMETYQCISLPTVHQPVHNLQYLHPEIVHAFPFAQQHKVMQEYPAQQLRSQHSRFAHAFGVGLVDFRFQQLLDEREKYGAEDVGPFLVVG